MLDDTNRITDSIRNQLIEFGVDPAKAHEASVRFHTVEAAANWAFGDGENVSL